MEWTVVTVVAALVGLFFTVGKPIIHLNSNIVKLNVSIEALRDRTQRQERDLAVQKEHAHESHKRLWDYNTQQDQRMDEHEKRIDRLEKQ